MSLEGNKLLLRGDGVFRYLTAGESHGPALSTIIEGVPAGLPIEAIYINQQLARRQQGYGRGKRMLIEEDRVKIMSGIRSGKTLGSPICLQIENKDWENWTEIMATENLARPNTRVVTRPRPGHADLPGALKYGHIDMRNVLERASARETAARVAAGSVARRFLAELDVEILGLVTRIGEIEMLARDLPLNCMRDRIEASPVMCPDSVDSLRMVEHIDRTRDKGDSLGGVFEIRVYGVPPGLGSCVHWDRRLDGRLAAALMSVQAIKGVELGLGFQGAGLPGSAVQDEIFYAEQKGFFRSTNHAGGIEGGISNGEPLLLRAAMKPIPTLHQPLKSVDFISREQSTATYERSDVCAVPAACVIGEAVVAIEVARAMLEKFGGDSMAEVVARKKTYEKQLKEG